MKKTILITTLFLLLIGCTNRDAPVDKTTLLGGDYRLFQNTPAWELAKAVDDGDTGKIKQEIKRQPELLEYPEPRFGHTLLQMAVINRNYPSVKALLELGADPNKQDKYYGDSPLMEALDIGAGGIGPHPDVDTNYLKILLKYGGNPNAVQNGDSTRVAQNRNTVLGIACFSGVLEYVKILVNAGADISNSNGFGYPCLDAAIISSNPDVVLYLLQKGADYSKPMYTNALTGKKVYILEDINNTWKVYKTPEFLKKKQQIIDFINAHHKKQYER